MSWVGGRALGLTWPPSDLDDVALLQLLIREFNKLKEGQASMQGRLEAQAREAEATKRQLESQLRQEKEERQATDNALRVDHETLKATHMAIQTDMVKLKAEMAALRAARLKDRALIEALQADFAAKDAKSLELEGTVRSLQAQVRQPCSQLTALYSPGHYERVCCDAPLPPNLPLAPRAGVGAPGSRHGHQPPAPRGGQRRPQDRGRGALWAPHAQDRRAVGPRLPPHGAAGAAVPGPPLDPAQAAHRLYRGGPGSAPAGQLARCAGEKEWGL
jgi:hypothetical protein